MNSITGQNNLTHVPPSIRYLTSLRELNLGGNQLRYLPSEIQLLPLQTVGLHPNPFMPPPASSAPSPKASPSTSIHKAPCFSPLETRSTLPSLAEYALRVLLSDASTSPMPTITSPSSSIHKKTILETLVELPLSNRYRLNSNMVRILEASCSTNVRPGRSRDAMDYVRGSVCPSKKHAMRAPTNFGSSAPPSTDSYKIVSASSCFEVLEGRALGVSLENRTQTRAGPEAYFHTPVESRYQWVQDIGLGPVKAFAGGVVPLLHQGCETGCLSFLEDRQDDGDDNDVEWGTL